MTVFPHCEGTICVADVDTKLREQPSLVASPHEPPELGPRPSLPRTVSMGTPCLPSAPLHLVGRVEAGVRGQGKGLLLVLFPLYYKPQLSGAGRGMRRLFKSPQTKGRNLAEAALAPPASFRPRPCPLLNRPRTR